MSGDVTSRPVLVYGVNGYTARLILPQLLERGIPVLLAGRTRWKVEEVAGYFGLPYVVVPLTEPVQLDAVVERCALVLNAAGPFVRTAPALIDACLRTRVDYLDLSGELESLAYAEGADKWARTLGVMLLPAVGFDVVPSDCLAVHAAQQLPGAERLRLFVAASNLLSRGSAVTLIEHAGKWIHTRRNGRLTPMAFRVLHQWVDFGAGPRLSVAVNWGDLITAYQSTGIPNIEVFFEATAFRWGAVVINQSWGDALRDEALQKYLMKFADLIPGGPNQTARSGASSTIVAEVTRGDEVFRSRLHTPEAYSFTADAVARVVEGVLTGARKPGFCTPASVLGSDFVLRVPSVRRVDGP